MSADTIEKVITNAIHTAFIKYTEGDGGPNLDYDWIPPEQSSHITKAILLDLEHFPLNMQHIRSCGSSWRIHLAGRHREGMRCGSRGSPRIARRPFVARL
jgi:hypothetical protein